LTGQIGRRGGPGNGSMRRSRESPRQPGGGSSAGGELFPGRPAEEIRFLHAIKKRLEEFLRKGPRRNPCQEENGEIVGRELKIASASDLNLIL
jgi:hypothetical protein